MQDKGIFESAEGVGKHMLTVERFPAGPSAAIDAFVDKTVAFDGVSSRTWHILFYLRLLQTDAGWGGCPDVPRSRAVGSRRGSSGRITRHSERGRSGSPARLVTGNPAGSCNPLGRLVAGSPTRSAGSRLPNGVLGDPSPPRNRRHGF